MQNIMIMINGKNFFLFVFEIIEAKKRVKNILTIALKILYLLKNRKNNFAIRDIEIQIEMLKKTLINLKIFKFEQEQFFKLED